MDEHAGCRDVTFSVEGEPLRDADEALVERARETCRDRFDPEFFDGAHIVAAALRTTDGAVYDGVSLPASVGASVCAERGAVNAAVVDGASRDAYDTIAAVAYPMDHHDADEVRVVPPCGLCRELLTDFAPDLRAVVPVEEEGGPLCTVRVADLLPGRTW